MPVAGTSPLPFETALQIENGDWRYDARKSQLVWEIDIIDQTNRTGAMEFVVPATDAGSFFPIEVGWQGQGRQQERYSIVRFLRSQYEHHG